MKAPPVPVPPVPPSDPSPPAPGGTPPAPGPAEARPQGRRAVKKVANRAALLAAAEAVFTDEGFEAASVRAISQRAGLALGTFYNYFPDKAAIFDAAIVEGFGRLQDSTERGRRAARDAATFWRAVLAPLFGGLVGEAGFYRLLLRTEALVRERHRALVVEGPQARLAADIATGVGGGWLPPTLLPPRLLAAAIYGAVFETCRSLLAEGPIDAARAEDTLVAATRLLLAGTAGGAPVAPPAAPPPAVPG